MKKIVLVCGLIAGIIVAAVTAIIIMMCCRTGNFEGNMALGYTTMFIAFSLIFVGVKKYRDKINNGTISFGKAFKIGLLITLVASSVYVVVWLIEYYLFVPDFMDRYAEHVLKQSSELSGAELKEKTDEINTYKEMYKNPLLVILLTYAEILPAGLLVSLFSALILKRKDTQPLQTV